MQSARGLIALTLCAGSLALAGPRGMPTRAQDAPPPPPPADLAAFVPATAVSALDHVARRFDERAAMDLVGFMDRYWRNAGNEGFNASIDRIKARLEASGFAGRAAGPADGPSVWVESFGRAPGWDYTVGTLALVDDAGQPDEMLLSRETHRVALCINSFSTPPGGVVAPIIDVGQGNAAADYDGKDVRGAVVIGDAGAARLWQMAVVQRGAVGVVSTALEAYIRPGPKPEHASKPKSEWDVLQWGGVPYNETRRGFGFKATPRAAAGLAVR